MNSDPSGRYVVDMDSLHRCGFGGKQCDEPVSKVVRGMQRASQIVAASSCGVHFGSGKTMFEPFGPPAIECDTTDGFLDRFQGSSNQDVIRSVDAFTVVGRPRIYLNCRSTDLGADRLGALFVHEGFHVLGRSHSPGSDADFRLMSLGCGIPPLLGDTL